MIKKKTTLPSFRIQIGKNILVEREKMNKLWLNIRSDNVTELNELIYAITKLASDKIDFWSGRG